MAIEQNDNFDVRAGKPTDKRFGPYISIEEANSSIPRAQRYSGLIVGIFTDPNDIVNSDLDLYKYYGDFSDSEIKPIVTERTPIHKKYATVNDMFAAQNEQIPQYVYYISSTDTYYEYIGTTNGVIGDYNPLGGSHIINITHAQLIALKNSQTLKRNQYYRITDYQTIHRITNTTTINYGQIEPLIVQTTDEKTVKSNVFSELFPFDTIEYNINEVLAEDNLTPKKGTIIFRRDNQRNISTYYDWREVKFRRWKVLSIDKEAGFVANGNDVTLTLTFSPNLTTTYLNTYRQWIISVPSTLVHGAGAINLTVSKGAINLTRPLYKKDGITTWNANELANKKGYISYCITRNVYVLMDTVDVGVGMINTYSSRISTLHAVGNNLRINSDANDFIDYFTFNQANINNGTVRDVELGRDSTNNVFKSNAIHVKIHGGCQFNTFNSQVQSFIMESEGLRNVFMGQLLWATYTTECWDNFHNNNTIYFKNYPYSVNTTFHLPAFNTYLDGGYVHNCTIIATGWGLYFRGTAMESSGIFTIGSNRSDFLIEKKVTGSLIGYFNSDNITIQKPLVNKSIHIKPKSNNLLDSINLSDLPLPEVGEVKALGIDERGNVVLGGVILDQNGQPLQHNNIPGLQGGVAGDFYHLGLNPYMAAIGANNASEINPFLTLVDLNNLEAGQGISIVDNKVELGEFDDYRRVLDISEFGSLGIFDIESEFINGNDRLFISNRFSTKSSNRVVWSAETFGNRTNIFNSGFGASFIAQASVTYSELDVFLGKSGDRLGFRLSTNPITTSGGNTNARFIDEISNRGLAYGGNYEANFIPTSLITKQYADTLVVTSAVTAGVGLSKTGNQIRLGDASGNTGVFYTPNSKFQVSTSTSGYGGDLAYNPQSGFYYVDMYLDNNRYVQMSMNMDQDSSRISSEIFDLASNKIGIYLTHNLTTGSSIIITDNINSKGAEYDGDYELNFTPRSLITKQHLDNELAAIITNLHGAGAGLSLDTNNNIQLGDNNTILFTPRSGPSEFNGFFSIRGEFEYYTADVNSDAGYQGLPGFQQNYVTALNSAIYEYWTASPNTADFNRETTAAGTGGQRATFFRQFADATNSYFELKPAIGLTQTQTLSIGLRDGVWATTFTDVANSRGIEYGGDYEVNFGPRTLITKQYLTGQIGLIPQISASLGLTKDGNDIRLGKDNFSNLTGTVSPQRRVIDYGEWWANNNSYFEISNTQNPNSPALDFVSFKDTSEDYQSLTISAGRNQASGQPNSINGNNRLAYLLIESFGNYFGGQNLATAQLRAGGKGLFINYSTTSEGIFSRMYFNDLDNQIGVEYAGDYEANFLPRSLITKQYVDGILNSIPVLNGGRGISVDVGNVRLGRNINNEIVIDLNEFTKPNNTNVKTLSTLYNNGGVSIFNNFLADNSNSYVQHYTDIKSSTYGALLGMESDPTYSYAEIGIRANHIRSGLSFETYSTDKIKLYDNIDQKGVVYGGDYEVNFVPRSLVTAQWVTQEIITNSFTHPTFTAFNLVFTGAEVLGNIVSNTQGHVTSITKRTLTLANLGYTGATNANFYVHPTHLARNINASGPQVVSAFTSDAEGHVTNITLRDLTTTDINAINTSLLGQANGVATLDSNGKLPESQIPTSLLGGVIYIDNWDANTNAPTLPDPATVKGWYYVVDVGGTVTGAQYDTGSINFNVGDWVISNGTVWKKVDNTDAVTMVFGRIGAITAQAGDYATYYVRHDINNQGLSVTDRLNARTNIEAQLIITGGATTITNDNLTINRALISDANGKVSVSTITSTELSYLGGVTSNIQLQLDSKLSGNQVITLTGDVTGSGTNSIDTTISTNAVTTTKILDKNVTYSKLQDVSANRILGRVTTTGTVQELTPLEIRTLINVADGANNYTHPTFTALSPTLTGANILATLVTNDEGHVTGITTRLLTPADINAVASERTIEINGVAQDLSVNRTWSVGTVTSVGLSVPTGFTIGNSPITTAGNLALGFVSGFKLFTDANETMLNTVNSWGNHALAGYLTSVPIATAAISGRVRLFSDTVQTVAASAVTATAARTYGLQFNASGQLVVNVPWVDTNTTYTTMTVAEGQTGTATTLRSIQANFLKDITDFHARRAISLTTVGNAGVATYINTTGVLNIPNYTLAGLGYTGALDANNYVHPTFTVRNLTLTGAQVLASFTSDAIGSVTGITTRNLTSTDIGAEPAFAKNSGFNLNLGTIAGTVAEGNHTHTFASLTAKPTTLLGYGITDAYDKTESDARYDNYQSWNLRTNGFQRIGIVSGGILDITGGTNVTVGYSAGGVVTINSTDTVYTSMTVEEGTIATETTGRVLQANFLKQIIDHHSRRAISLTTVGTTGLPTYDNTTGVLNIPSHAPLTLGVNVNGLQLDTVTQVLQLGLSSATTTGALSSTDWTIFNNKIDGIGTLNYIPRFTAPRVIGNSQIIDNGTNILINKTTDNGEKLQVQGNITVSDRLIGSSQNLSVTTTPDQIIGGISSVSYTAAFFDFVIKNGTNLRAGTVYAVHDGTNVKFTETSTSDLGDTSPVYLKVILVDNNIRLVANTTTTGWSIKCLIRGL